MDSLDYDHTVHQSDAGDAKLHVTFYMHFIQNMKKSEAAGHPVFDDVPFTRIFMPGDRTNIIDRPTRDSDQLRWPGQWMRFQKGQEQRADGMPISEWPIVTRGQAEELKHLGFSTVEQIAEANDNINFMGIQTLKAKARAFLEVSKGSTAPIEKLTKQVEELIALNKVQAEAIELLKAQKKTKQES